MKPWVGIALMHEAEFIAATLPLFEAGEIDVLEWSFDTITHQHYEPSWLPLLLQDYSMKGRLLAHGVRYSLLSGDFSQRQKTWLRKTEAELKRYTYRHITEHFGFMSSGHFHKGAPLPVPLNSQSLSLGRDRLQRLQQSAGIPVGIENLAFAFNASQVKEQAGFLEKLVAPINGFLILDLHNIWCQAINFKIDAHKLVDAYPLHLVREIHISGGSWSGVSSSKISVRRDTHDDAVPDEVFSLLAYALPKCRGTEAVIFERIGNSLNSEAERIQFILDFRTVKKTVDEACPNQKAPAEIVTELPDLSSPISKHALEDTSLSKQQQTLISLLTKNSSVDKTIQSIKTNHLLKESGWQPETWSAGMIETAIQLLKKWG